MQQWPRLLKNSIHLGSFISVVQQEASRSAKKEKGSREGDGKRWRCKGRNRRGGASDAWCGRVWPLHLLPQREAPPPGTRVTSHGHLLRLAVAWWDAVPLRFCRNQRKPFDISEVSVYRFWFGHRPKKLDPLIIVASFLVSFQVSLKIFLIIFNLYI